jgi:hypothetical protein
MISAPLETGTPAAGGSTDSSAEERQEFILRDCALIELATGIRAHNLHELRSGLEKAPTASIYHHFWGRLLRPQFDEPEYNNDFASWAYHALHDKPLAERLSILSPTDFDDLERLREIIVELVEQRLDEREAVAWAPADNMFHFQQARIVVFDTGMRFTSPENLVYQIDSLSLGSIYYHVIDARSRTENHCDDFTAWFEGFGSEYTDVTRKLGGMDPYFSSLGEIRHCVSEILTSYYDEVNRGKLD